MTKNNQLIKLFKEKSIEHFNMMAEKGFDEYSYTDIEYLALISTEISEAIEAIRKGNKQSIELPEFLDIELELADLLLRVMHYATKKNYHIMEALIAKMNYNSTRPYKHNKKL